LSANGRRRRARQGGRDGTASRPVRRDGCSGAPWRDGERQAEPAHGAGTQGAGVQETDVQGVGAQGFSLLEVLVALVVLGLLIGTLTQGVRFGVGAIAAQARIVGVRGDEDAVERALRRMVEHMDPGTFSTPPQMAGTASRLEFVTDLPLAASLLADPPAPRVDAALEVDGRHRLVLRWRPHVGGQRLAPAPPVAEEMLLSGVDRVTFGYLSEQGWQDAWHGTELPLLVRVHVGFPKGDRRSWPDLVAAPRRQRPDQ
jgi:general secretion pathway protein J